MAALYGLQYAGHELYPCFDSGYCLNARRETCIFNIPVYMINISITVSNYCILAVQAPLRFISYSKHSSNENETNVAYSGLSTIKSRHCVSSEFLKFSGSKMLSLSLPFFADLVETVPVNMWAKAHTLHRISFSLLAQICVEGLSQLLN